MNTREKAIAVAKIMNFNTDMHGNFYDLQLYQDTVVGLAQLACVILEHPLLIVKLHDADIMTTISNVLDALLIKEGIIENTMGGFR